MPRRSLALLAAGVVGLSGGLAACRSDTVELGFDPAEGATYRYRYEIDLHLERALEGEEPTVTDLRSTITARVTIVDETPAGARARLLIRRDGGGDQRLTVLLDRAGSLRGIEQIAGLPEDTLGVGDLSALLGLSVAPPPDGPVSIGDTWAFGEDSPLPRPVTGEARLDRLGVIDGEQIAEVGSALRQSVDDDVDAGPSGAHLVGELRTDLTTSYDLDDGAIRRGHATSTASVTARIEPPSGSTATPVQATITYELTVTTTRLS
jgi:hypothetical protein